MWFSIDFWLDFKRCFGWFGEPFWRDVALVLDLFAIWWKLEKSHGVWARAPKLRICGIENAVNFNKKRIVNMPKNCNEKWSQNWTNLDAKWNQTWTTKASKKRCVCNGFPESLEWAARVTLSPADPPGRRHIIKEYCTKTSKNSIAWRI